VVSVIKYLTPVSTSKKSCSKTCSRTDRKPLAPVPRSRAVSLTAVRDHWALILRLFSLQITNVVQGDNGMQVSHEFVREPSREEIDRMEGAVLLEFGASWCGRCLGLAPELSKVLEDYPAVRHIKVEDEPGNALGRSFPVKLWPTLVFMRDGRIVKQVSRPDIGEVREGLAAIAEA
jgi:thioredoxin 1